MIDKPSLFDNPNLANKGTFVESPLPGESVDTCYAFDSTIRHEYDGTQDWDEGKEVQETLPAAQWDAMVHDLNAFNVQTTELLNSIYEEIYCLIHGSTVGYDQAALNAILTGAYTFTNKTISFDDNTLTNVASLDTAQTLTNKTINFNDNTLQNVASLNTAQTLTNKTINYQNNTILNSPKQYPVSSETSATHNFIKEEDIRINTAPFTLTLGTGAYVGQKVTVYSVQSGSYIIFTTHPGNTVCVGISGGVRVSFTCVNSSSGYWYADSGSVFGVYDSFYGSRPTGTIPSNWKDFYGVGTYTFGTATIKLTEYDIPEGNLNIHVTWRGYVSASAIAESNYYASGSESAIPNTYVRRYYSANGATGWSSDWQGLTTNAGTQTLTNKTINFANNTLTGVASTSTVQTLTYKTMDTTLNRIFCSPTLYSIDTSPNVDRDLFIRMTGAHTVLTLPANAAYRGATVTVQADTDAFVIYTSVAGNVCLYVSNDILVKITYIGGGRWSLESGTTIRLYGNALTYAPAGYTTPGTWKSCYGLGTYHFINGISDTDSQPYDFPGAGYCSITVTWLVATTATATAVRWNDYNTIDEMWIRNMQDIWTASWEKVTTGNSFQILKNKTISTRDNKIVPEPIFITADYISANGHTVTPDAYRKYVGAVQYEYITLGSSIGAGNKITVGSWVDHFYVIYKNLFNNMVCLSLNSGQYINFISYADDRWELESGTQLFTSATAQTNAPWKDPNDHSLGRYLPNSYKDFLGLGSYFIYDTGATSTDYEYPGNMTKISLIVNQHSPVNMTVQAQRETLTASSAQFLWIRKCSGSWGAWQTISSDDATTSLTNKTISFSDNTLTGVASTSTAQTLTNKTIDANSNTLKNVVTSKNITNCITEIPQDINLTLSSGTLTLKEGSKVFVPNGANTFDVLNIDVDKTFTNLSTDGTFMFCTASNGTLIGRYFSNCVSGAGATTISGFAYNTTTNQVRDFSGAGTDYGYNCSLPICVITVSGGVPSLDQVFNGMGYIGSTLFVLPGVKAVVPHGRNTDGTLKNYYSVITQVKTTENTYSGTRIITLDGIGQFTALGDSWYYDENRNIYTNGSTDVTITPIAVFDYAGGAISNFKPKTTFHAVDYNDFEELAEGIDKTVTMTMTFTDNTTATYEVRIK